MGGLLSSEIARRHGTEGLPEGSIEVKLRGSAGQSFGAWLAPGVCLALEGDANDYIGKGLSGGTLIVRPHRGATYPAEDNVVIGNVALYGATQGRAFFRGLAGERFAVRNSGAVTVVEGIGDHGCEYMTGGRVVVLGPTGINFAAGMSGGIAYVLDDDGGFRARCNTEMVRFAEISEAESKELLALIEEHRDRTGSPVAAGLVGDWDDAVRPLREGAALRLRARAGRAGPPGGDRRTRRRGLRHMADPKGFLKVERVGPRKRDPRERVHDYHQYFAFPDERTLREQGGRCMSCGIPFCHEGCPLGNLIPEWNDLVHQGSWREALNRLHATNNFPEFTGLICPAPCESACVLDINDDPVTIEQIEGAIAERGWAEGWIVPEPPEDRSGKTRRRGRLGPGRHGRGGRAQQARPPGHGVRARRVRRAG